MTRLSHQEAVFAVVLAVAAGAAQEEQMQKNSRNGGPDISAVHISELFSLKYLSSIGE